MVIVLQTLYHFNFISPFHTIIACRCPPGYTRNSRGDCVNGCELPTTCAGNSSCIVFGGLYICYCVGTKPNCTGFLLSSLLFCLLLTIKICRCEWVPYVEWGLWLSGALHEHSWKQNLWTMPNRNCRWWKNWVHMYVILFFCYYYTDVNILLQRCVEMERVR